MSRIGKKPVTIPGGVEAKIDGNTFSVKGPLGSLELAFRDEVEVVLEDDPKQIVVSRKKDNRDGRALHGLTRALIANMVEGVSNGYQKRLEVVGVGYLAAISGDTLQLRVGFANELQVPIPAELDVKCPDQTHIVIKGTDKQKVGQFAAEVRSLRKPEPYKGKGIRYEGEHVRRKAGKAVGA